MKKLKLLIMLILNLLVTISSIIGCFIIGGRLGTGMLAFYTVDSNLLAAVACGIYAVFILRTLLTGKGIPSWAIMLKYISVCCLSVTFIVVVTVLAPMNGLIGYQKMLFEGDMLYQHLISPVVIFVSYLLFDRIPLSAVKAAGIAIIPTIAYAFVTLILNVAKIMEGPYPFLHVYEQPVYMSFIWFILIGGGAYLAALLLGFLKNSSLVS